MMSGFAPCAKNSRRPSGDLEVATQESHCYGECVDFMAGGFDCDDIRRRPFEASVPSDDGTGDADWSDDTDDADWSDDTDGAMDEDTDGTADEDENGVWHSGWCDSVSLCGPAGLEGEQLRTGPVALSYERRRHMRYFSTNLRPLALTCSRKGPPCCPVALPFMVQRQKEEWKNIPQDAAPPCEFS
jgi:hypothetical protein